MDPRLIQKRITELQPWYQNIDLTNEISTNPANPNYPQDKWDFIEKHIPKNLEGKTVLDIGCNAGFFSIKMKERGAKHVVGIDYKPINVERARFVAEVLNMDIEYRLGDVYETILTSNIHYDYVIFLGLFYHLRYPLIVLDKLSEITKEKLIFQTEIRGTPTITNPSSTPKPLRLEDDYDGNEKQIFEHPDFPKMFFIEKKYNHDYTNWWFCNDTGIVSILRSAGFQNITKSGNVFICNAQDTNLVRKTSDFQNIKKIFKNSI